MRIGVIGAGAWGTALATVAVEGNHEVLMWAREAEVVESVRHTHVNTVYLADVPLPPSLGVTNDLHDLANCEVIIHATPTQFARRVLTDAQAAGVLANATLVTAAKGVELVTHKLLHEIVAEVAPGVGEFVVLSGPSHAEEVVRRMPTTVVCASLNLEAATKVQSLLHTEFFRVYTSTDVTGVEICGALKNVIAIAAGIVDGAGMGDNTKAALMTRGLAEIARLGAALNAERQTFYGLAGMGDLIVTAGSKHSRNRYVGEQVGKGRRLDDVLASMTSVAEGVTTTTAALELAAAHNVELPIIEQVGKVLFHGANPLESIRELMMRPLTHEDPDLA
ncbi:MAG: NAD(P)-dependent glycerol-3-phosphate dehydrogenase [Bradyrhizobiaceae bacterium]|nr:NAD(P)-dependent glycerol-3-phosphate dehydrogenase [Bradyrhizobiaceae bacterium]